MKRIVIKEVDLDFVDTIRDSVFGFPVFFFNCYKN